MNRPQTQFFRVCALCGENRKLERSHIIPQFVHRWCNEQSGASDLDRGKALVCRNRPESTRHMLCGSCEDLFSSFESEFARVIFHPTASGGPLKAKYSGWLRKFAVSVCWRILEENLAEKRLDHFQGHWKQALASCRSAWNQYLSGKRPDVGVHDVHLLISPMDRLVPRGMAQSQGTGRVVASDVCCNDSDVFVYAELGPIILFGVIVESARGDWHGTRIHAEGKIKPRAISTPARYQDFISLRERRSVAQ